MGNSTLKKTPAMPRILGAFLARHFLRKLISRFLAPGVDLESGENAAEKAPMVVRSMMDRVIQPPHLHIRIKSTTYSSVYLQSIHVEVHADEKNGHCFTAAFLFEANVLHLNCN